MFRLQRMLSAGVMVALVALLINAAPVLATYHLMATATLRPPPPITDYVCPGDCNRDRAVMVNEVVSGVNIALDRATVDTCLQADADGDGSVRVNELVGSVNSVLGGCPPLGTRRFSLDPRTSSFAAVLNLGAFPTFGSPVTSIFAPACRRWMGWRSSISPTRPIISRC